MFSKKTNEWLNINYPDFKDSLSIDIFDEIIFSTNPNELIYIDWILTNANKLNHEHMISLLSYDHFNYAKKMIDNGFDLTSNNFISIYMVLSYKNEDMLEYFMTNISKNDLINKTNNINLIVKNIFQDKRIKFIYKDNPQYLEKLILKLGFQSQTNQTKPKKIIKL